MLNTQLILSIDVNLRREREDLSLKHIDLKVLNIVSKTISRMMANVDGDSLVKGGP